MFTIVRTKNLELIRNVSDQDIDAINRALNLGEATREKRDWLKMFALLHLKIGSIISAHRSLTGKYKTLSAEKDQKEAELAQLNQKYRNKEKEVLDLKKDVKELQAQFTHQTNELAKARKQIKSLEAKLDPLSGPSKTKRTKAAKTEKAVNS